MGAMLTVNGGDFAGVAVHEGSVITVKLTGNADYAALDALEMLVDRVHAEASRLGVTETIVDLRQLEFMNSSCFKSVVSWIGEIREMESDRQYKLRFVSNPKMHWQKRSLHSLRCFAIELITVTEQQ